MGNTHYDVYEMEYMEYLIVGGTQLSEITEMLPHINIEVIRIMAVKVAQLCFFDVDEWEIYGTDIRMELTTEQQKETLHVIQRSIDTGKLRICITSIFDGTQTLNDKLFLIADRKIKNYLAKTDCEI